MIRTQILLPEDLLYDLRMMAAENDWSVSKTVRELVKEKIKRVKVKRKTGVKAMLQMAGNAYKGDVPTDLSTNDEYLYGKIKR